MGSEVSEGRTPTELDPRFDPRFQRGYVPDAAASGSESVPPPPAEPTAPAPAPDADAASPGDPAAAILGLLAHAQAERLAGHSHEPDDSDPRDDQQAEPDPHVFTSPVEPQVQPRADAEPIVHPSPARWFWIALAACFVFVVIGIALFWNGASDRSMFTAAPSSLEGAFNQFSMALAPALVQAGVLGSIVVLVTWAITGRRSRKEAA
jgi:uncharacterized protein YjeT (DUF2065 family)